MLHSMVFGANYFSEYVAYSSMELVSIIIALGRAALHTIRLQIIEVTTRSS